MENGNSFELTCPVPLQEYPNVLLAHGSGGRLMQRLIDQMFVKTFNSDALNERHDAAKLNIADGKRLAFTTDSYVVNPIEFPGGNIGSLAIHGTVNDLTMAGAKPLYISTGYIIEEGFPMETLWRVVRSMKEAADEVGVAIVTGDTKVVERGKGDGVYINTAGVGELDLGLNIGPQFVQPEDVVIVSGDLGRHGMAIMSAREGLGFESDIISDSAPLVAMVHSMLDAGIEIHCLRDLTRGGLASGLHEISETARTPIIIQEPAVPVQENVRALCEVLGLDPFHVANEGRLVAFVPAKDADKALEIIQEDKHGKNAAIIGEVGQLNDESHVTLISSLGTKRYMTMLSGQQLPRIC